MCVCVYMYTQVVQDEQGELHVTRGATVDVSAGSGKRTAARGAGVAGGQSLSSLQVGR